MGGANICPAPSRPDTQSIFLDVRHFERYRFAIGLKQTQAHRLGLIPGGGVRPRVFVKRTSSMK